MQRLVMILASEPSGSLGGFATVCQIITNPLYIRQKQN